MRTLTTFLASPRPRPFILFRMHHGATAAARHHRHRQTTTTTTNDNGSDVNGGRTGIASTENATNFEVEERRMAGALGEMGQGESAHPKDLY